jgi:hypothetical protein
MFFCLLCNDDPDSLVEIDLTGHEIPSLEEGEVLLIENVSKASLVLYRKYLTFSACADPPVFVSKLSIREREELKRIVKEVGYPQRLIHELNSTPTEETALLKMFKSKMKLK